MTAALKNTSSKVKDSALQEVKRERHVVTDDMEIYGIFKAMYQRKEKLWAWQSKDPAAPNRPVHYALIRKVDIIKKTIEIIPNNAGGFKFSAYKDLFLYSTHRGVALKIKMREFDPFYITFTAPKKLNILAKDFLTNIELVEKENEESNRHKRNAARLRAKQDQVVGLIKMTINQPQRKFYTLYDISQSGMGMIVFDPAEFEMGDKLEVVSINNKDLPRHLSGRVVALKQMDENGECHFKVGVKFDEPKAEDDQSPTDRSPSDSESDH